MEISDEYVFFLCRGSTREKALASIIEAFNSSLQHEFVEKKYLPFLSIVMHSSALVSHRQILS